MWQGQRVGALRESVGRLLADTGRPAALLLQEARHWPRGWEPRGYRALPSDGDMAIVLRDDAEVIASGTWTVPGGGWVWNGKDRGPRVWPWVVARFGATTVALVNVHQIPNGPNPYITRNARAWASGQRMLAEKVPALARKYGCPVVLGGDWNARMDASPEHPASMLTLADSLGAKVRVRYIDGFLIVGAGAGKAEKLEDKYGSDAHRPVVVEVQP